ncbi:hypothetical protein ESCO_002894 [Escovopsis weberi]|uniref:Uncharacterized protein n=1 Tax=Escovopsis weberi TaxID=150374 RepID=A0A0M8MV65_ESCWE|nr:hypothetical protein ESCO_002894 [Escovopsis weberi]
MVRPPSHIFIVRHGSRLDSADKDWHLTSATPYDTPLTYGGFLQARQVGNQISTLLAQAKVEAEVSKNGEVISGRHRRFRIVIHTSPYLRCLQTSIGISSGLSQTPLGSIYQPSDLIVPRGAPDSPQSQFKSTLIRVDAFLGEWLAPEYFEKITPPPDAALMVAGAKAELLRREDYSMYTTPVHTSAHRPRASTSSLWNGSQSLPFPDLAGLPPSSVSENDPDASDSPSTTAPVRITPRHKAGYVAPQPPFAVSSRGKVPDGLVAHARDACTLVDYPWDSMIAPLDFGDGGVLADEWSTMHKRFRSGLRKMVNWYATTQKPDELQPLQSSKPSEFKTEGAQGPDEESAPGDKEEEEEEENDEDDDDDDDIETVVILVSHGAGCNALMGAVTDQPVLCDVGIASISMAVRKESLDYSQAFLRTRPQDPAPLRLVPVDQMYDLRVEVSTDHLRPGTSASVSSPDSARPPSASSNIWGSFSNAGRRGRTGTESSTTMGGPVLNPFAHRDSPGLRGGNQRTGVNFGTRNLVERHPTFWAMVSATRQFLERSPEEGYDSDKDNDDPNNNNDYHDDDNYKGGNRGGGPNCHCHLEDEENSSNGGWPVCP